MKYVEAMYLPEQSAIPMASAEPDYFDATELEASIDDARVALDGLADEAGIRACLKALADAADDFIDTVDDHECDSARGDSDWEPDMFVPVGQTVPIRHQMMMASFLPGEETAIVKLSDLKVLIEAAGVKARAQ